MALNFLQEGSFLTLTAPRNLNPGDGCLIGHIFGVSQDSYISGNDCVLGVEGVWSLTKNGADVLAAGDFAYWDDTNHFVTATATGNTKIGVATAAADGTMSAVNVRLNEAF